MIDIEKIKIMTKLATYEKRQGKKDIEMNRYSRQDYIKYKMFWSSIAATVAFLIGCFLCLLWGIDWVMTLSNKSSYIFCIGIIAIFYIIFLLIYRKFLRKFYDRSYTQMIVRIEEYRQQLKDLQKIYDRSRSKE